MKVLQVKNLQFTNEDKSEVTCDVLFEEIGEFIPFSANRYDKLEHSQEIWNSALSGKYGKVKPFILNMEVIVNKNTINKEKVLERVRSEMSIYQIDLTLGTITSEDKEKLIKLLSYYKEIEKLDPTNINMEIPNLK